MWLKCDKDVYDLSQFDNRLLQNVTVISGPETTILSSWRVEGPHPGILRALKSK